MTHRFYKGPTVTLIVGKNRESFNVHLDLLCNTSSFFKAAFLGDFKENSEKTMQLPEDDESIFELFVDWLYYQRYEMLPEEEDNDNDNNDDDDDKRFLQAFQLFVFADKYEVSKLKSLVVETLFVDGRPTELRATGPSIDSIAYAYEHTTQESGLRKLLADWSAFNIRLEWYECSDVQAFLRKQPEFATDLSVSFAVNLHKGHTYNPFEEDMPEKYKD